LNGFWLRAPLAVDGGRRSGIPAAIASFLELTLRYQFRLVAYHLSLVNCYPSFEQAPGAPRRDSFGRGLRLS
jgi:hypothetical protein